MRKSTAALYAALAGSAMLVGCNPGSTTVSLRPTPIPTTTPPSGGTPTPTPTPASTATPTPLPTGTGHPTPTPKPTATAQPQVVHIGFELAPEIDPTFGPVAFYAPTLSPPDSAVIKVKSGSQLVFLNDGTKPATDHTASLLGTSGFPPSGFGSNNPFSPTGSTIGATFWSTGTLSAGSMSAPFTVGPPGTYYFGCGFHYGLNPSMQDVIVSQ